MVRISDEPSPSASACDISIVKCSAQQRSTLSEQSSKKDGQPADSWFERLGILFALGSLDTGYVPPSPTVLYEGQLVGVEDRLIREIVDDHVGVIVGRGAARSSGGVPVS